jgi:hypothetical protein
LHTKAVFNILSLLSRSFIIASIIIIAPAIAKAGRHREEPDNEARIEAHVKILVVYRDRCRQWGDRISSFG